MQWDSRPFGGVLALPAASNPLGTDLELEIVTSDGLTWGMWILPLQNVLIAVVAAAEA